MDALQERAPFDRAAKEILSRAQGGGEFKAVFTANAASDIFYLYRKARDSAAAKAALAFLIEAFGVVSVTRDDCSAALASSIEDFEDALVAVCAEKEHVDYIITRDERFLQAISSVRSVTPMDLLAII